MSTEVESETGLSLTPSQLPPYHKQYLIVTINIIEL